MPLDNNSIETLSVNAVKNSIVMSELLAQFIADNDKEPSWDGFVYIYGDKSKAKSKLKGRMPVQVKGTECDDHSKDTISFKMPTVDLRNYLYDGGCILFVVYIGNHGLTNKIYYVELTPVKLRKLLEEAKGQDHKTVYLKEFPADNNKKATIFLNCLQNCQRQSNIKEEKLFTLKELSAQGVLENVVIPVSGVGKMDPQMALVKNEIYLYAKIKGSTILQPLDIIPQDIHMQQSMDALITINDKVFYTNYKVTKSAKETTLCIGESFQMRIDEICNSCTVEYKDSNKIRVLERDLDFILSYMDKGFFKINDIEIPLECGDIDFSNFDKEKERERLLHVKEIVRVLNILGCTDDIDISDLNDSDWRNLHYLIIAFLNKKPVEGLKENLPPVITIKVGKMAFAVYLKPCEKKGTYEMFDFFDTDISCKVTMEDGNSDKNTFFVSQFSILHEKDFLTLSNIKFDILLPSFQKIEHNRLTFSKANEFLLELLKAYDKAKGIRKKQILETCKAFSTWISKAPQAELDNQIRTLNVLQTIKRYRNFNINEIETLYSMVENKDIGEECIVGAYLLLEQQQAAEIHFARLSKEEQNSFKQYPIYHFWKIEE